MLTIPLVRRMKRLIDIGVSLAALTLLSPLMGAAAGAIFLSIGRPVFFRQERAGYLGRRFNIVKFRTMTDQRDAEGRLLDDADRLTRFGALLRKTSVDELPQLWNVLKGDMSLVGPRPLPVEYMSLYTPQQARRHEVPAGMISWAGVRGRNANTWEKKFELDLYYVNNWTLLLDLKILLMAIPVVLSGAGVNEAGSATSSRFTGTTGGAGTE